MSTASIALYLRSLNYKDLYDVAQVVHDGFVANVATYPAPPVSTAAQQATVTALHNAIEAWGVKGNRGSRQSRVALVVARNDVRAMLKKLAFYCMTVTPDDPASWMAVGFVTEKTRERANIPGAVQDLRQMTTGNILPENIKMVWKKPLGSERRRTLYYRVLRSADPNLDNATEVAIVTKTTFTDTTVGRGALYYYWVVPVNAYGIGIVSPGCSGATLRMV